MSWTQKNSYEISEAENIEDTLQAIREVLASKFPDSWKGYIIVEIMQDGETGNANYSESLLPLIPEEKLTKQKELQAEIEEEYKRYQLKDRERNKAHEEAQLRKILNL